MANPEIHLVCNAHLDPVWLWEWEEGAAEALSTFRVAADFCDNYKGFVFCHNEAILYRWVEEYEPSLFMRIRKLVKAGQWHVMGGWHLQPDCNMPEGETIIRQMRSGLAYFREKFGVRPTTAINFDPFGHSRGLVQLLAKGGYDSYIICRPCGHEIDVPYPAFNWVGFDNSRIMVARVPDMYCSQPGKAEEKLNNLMKHHGGSKLPVLLLWGVGNHGGGPYRKDLEDFAVRTKQNPAIRHSTPEAYFKALRKSGAKLKDVDISLRPSMVGCYTSQIRIKQQHRRLEHDLFMTEKMAAAAGAAGLMSYPSKELDEAELDLLTANFHDILPGSSIKPAEEMALRVISHGREILSRVRARAFFALASGQPKAKPDTIPVMVYNPHPWVVETDVVCEFNLAAQNWSDTFTLTPAYANGKRLPSQAEQEESHLNLDWRKRVVFRARLAPSSMNRFDCLPEKVPARPMPQLKARNGKLRIAGDDLTVAINTKTGLVDSVKVKGVEYLGKSAFKPEIFSDTPESWSAHITDFTKIKGGFALMKPKEAAAFSNLEKSALPSVRVIEEGEVRTVVEALFAYGRSTICQHYVIPKKGTELGVEMSVHWHEADSMLKLALPANFRAGSCVGETMCGFEELPLGGRENVSQKWIALVSPDSKKAVTCITDGTYASNVIRDKLYITCLRSPAYSAHNLGRPLLPDDRHTPRMEQGEREFKFWINCGPWAERRMHISREALERNEPPMALSFFPKGDGRLPGEFISLDDKCVIMLSALKAADGKGWIIRLFEPSGQKRKTNLRLRGDRTKQELRFDPFEVKTVRLDPKFSVAECGLLE